VQAIDERRDSFAGRQIDGGLLLRGFLTEDRIVD
jgi:hypothetical protein